jgi:hypothetical protein
MIKQIAFLRWYQTDEAAHPEPDSAQIEAIVEDIGTTPRFDQNLLVALG